MEEEKPRSTWRIIGKSVRGASHVRGGLPNQDAIRWEPESGQGAPLILAVSDGHGSNKCFRSHVGAETAVRIATKSLQELLDGQPDLTNLSAIKRTAEERLPQQIVREWKSSVQQHLGENPFSEEEWTRLAEKEGGAARQLVEGNPALAYGATLVTALLQDEFILYLQLGDGEILTVSESGEVSRPLPSDERLIANETTSLCGPNAWSDFRVGFQALSTSPPALILLSTDGYPNSFRDEQGFFKVGVDILDMIRVDGLEKVNSSLEGWLAEASSSGSGDDVTVGIIKRDEDKDIDSIHRRIMACEVKLRGKEDERIHLNEQGRRLEGVESSVKDLKQQLQDSMRRIFKLQWGFILASLLGAGGIVLAVLLWARLSGPVSEQKSAARAPRAVENVATQGRSSAAGQ
jgi:serine/threonine protein phosphatase PrpC